MRQGEVRSTAHGCFPLSVSLARTTTLILKGSFQSADFDGFYFSPPTHCRVRDHLLYMEVGANNADTGNIASEGCGLSCCRFFPASDRFYPAAVYNFSPLRRECIFSSANLFFAAANVFSC